VDQEVKEWKEEQLRCYPTLKSQIKNKRNQILHQEDYAAKGVSYSNVGSGKTNAFYSDVEDFIEDKLDKYPDLIELELAKERIDSSLECLTERQKNLVEYKYFEDLTDLETVFRMRDYEHRIIKRLCKNDESLLEDYNGKEYSVPTIQRMKLDVLEKLENTGICEIEQTLSTN